MYGKWQKSFRNYWIWQRRKLVRPMRRRRKFKTCWNHWILIIIKQSCYMAKCHESEFVELFSTMRTTHNHNISFPRKESDGTQFSQFDCKRVLPNGLWLFSGVVSPNFFWESNNIFVWDAPSQSTKWLDMLKIWETWPPGPPWLRLWLIYLASKIESIATTANL